MKDTIGPRFSLIGSGKKKKKFNIPKLDLNRLDQSVEPDPSVNGGS